MELDKEDVARRATSCVFEQEYSCAVGAWIAYANKIMHYDSRSRRVFSLPYAAVVQLLSQSPHVQAKESFTRLPKIPVYPLHFPPSIIASRSSYP
jgi:hypothetical protein